MDGGNLKNLYTGNLENIGFIAADISTMKLYWGVSGSGVVRKVILVKHIQVLAIFWLFNMRYT